MDEEMVLKAFDEGLALEVAGPVVVKARCESCREFRGEKWSMGFWVCFGCDVRPKGVSFMSRLRYGHAV